MKNLLIVFIVVLALIFMPMTVFTAFAAESFPDAVLITPKDYDGFKVYSAPDSEIYLGFSLEDGSFYADSSYIVNEKNNTKRYRVVYCWYYGDWAPKQINRMEHFNNNYFYVNATDITTSPAGDDIKAWIDWLRAGRPTRYKVGEVFKYDEGITIDDFVTIELTDNAILLEEPREGARTIEAPKGLICLGRYSANAQSFPLYAHADMEEEAWSLIIEVKTGKILGWIKTEQLYEISKWIEPVL